MTETQSGISFTLHVNRADYSVTVPAHHTLLEVLRDEIGLLSVREGCGIGMCGACTVLVDGRPISACLTLAAMAEGHDILTVEGLGELPPLGEDGVDRSLHPIQQAFIAKSG